MSNLKGQTTVVSSAGYNGEQRARQIANSLRLPYARTPPQQGVLLVVGEDRLALRLAGQPASRAIHADFASAQVQRRIRAGKSSLLARALGLHRRPGQSVVDATCGLGRDSAVLLGLGCTVRAFERAPVLAALLEDAIRRLDCPPARWQGLHCEDAKSWLEEQQTLVADVIYIDPMFAGTRRNALPKWDMQILRHVAGDDTDSAQLLAAARKVARRRVVVKRHPRDQPVAKPQHSLEGRRACYDIYLQTDRERR